MAECEEKIEEEKILGQFQTIVDDNIIQIHLLYIPLFLHWDDTTVVAQTFTQQSDRIDYPIFTPP
jgi:hypothetical protein